MTRIFHHLAFLLIFQMCTLICWAQSDPNASFQEISFHTQDSVLVYGDLHHLHKDRPVILLFHQAGANGRAEYEEVIPILTEKEFNVLAIDQRSGGQRFGGYNRTVALITNNNYSYCEAYPDLVGALDFLVESGYTGHKILWGSSYSAALVVRLAHAQPDDIAGVLAFSPASGGPMQACKADDLFETLEVPLLLMRPAREMEVESVANQYQLALQHGHQTFVVENGVHGSSMMVGSRVSDDPAQQWGIVMTFIERCLKMPK
ncbi:MAG: lysophospholipase [Cyclobacteriaceae bacterium]|nr:lysophospholipase [Cyclobacteriaceae bacterium]